MSAPTRTPAVATSPRFTTGIVHRIIGVMQSPAPRVEPVARRSIIARVLRLVALAVALVVAVAPIVAARWQLLDDGLIVDGSLARFDSPINQQFRDMGRNFYPAGLYFETQRQVFGTWIRGFYVVQGIVFLATCLLIHRIVRRFPHSEVTAPLAVILFAFGSPVPEVTNTLYKFEVRLTLFWLAASLLAIRFLESLAPDSPKRRWASLGLAGLVVYAGYFLGKETIAALPLVAVLVGVIGLITARRGQRRYAGGLLAISGVSGLAIVAAMKTNRWIGVRSVSEGSYTSGNFKLLTDHLSARLEVFFIAVPDVLLLATVVALLGLVALLAIVVRRGFDPWAAAAGMAVGSCLVMFAFNVLLWGMIQVYYNYPVSAFGAVALGLIVPLIGRIESRSLRWPAVGIGAALVAAVLVAAVPLHLSRMAMYRKALRADAAMLAHIAELPPNARVAVNIPPDHEALRNAELVLAFVHNRSDIRFESALTEQYRTRQHGANEFVAHRTVGWMNWLLGGRDLGRTNGFNEAELWLLRNLGGNWQEIARVHPSPVAYHHHWRLYKGGVRTLREKYQFEYEWKMYQRR